MTTFEYDGLHRMTDERWYTNQNHLQMSPGSPLRTISYAFDKTGLMTSAAGPDAAYTYTHDALGRLDVSTQSIAGLTAQVSFDNRYSPAGQMISQTASIGTAVDHRNVYRYDALDRLTVLTQEKVAGTGNHAAGYKRVSFSYDALGRFDHIWRFAGISEGATAVAVSDYEFDRAGRLVGLEHRGGYTPGSGTLLAGYEWTWDRANRLAGMDFLPDGVNSPFDYSAEDVSFSYDDRGQLTGADRSLPADDESYVYDDNGNRTLVDGSTSYMITANNRLQSDGTYLYQYDAEGNRTVRTQIATGDFTVYEWDHRNRLVKVSEYNGSVTLLQTVEHTYDPFNQWVTRTVDADGQTGSAALQKTVFVHEGGQIVLQFDKTGSGDAVAGDLSHRYLWGPAVDQLLADEAVGSLTSPGVVLWPLADHLGTVRDVVDSAGMVRKHVEYDPFGNVLDEDYFDAAGNPVSETHAEAVDVLFGYTGAAEDESTGLIQRRRRWVDPQTATFLSEDLIWDGYNRYSYVGNTPTSKFDPSGLEEASPVGQFFLGLVQGGANIVCPFREPQAGRNRRPSTPSSRNSVAKPRNTVPQEFGSLRTDVIDSTEM